MMKTIAGICQPDSGTIWMRSEAVRFRDAAASKAAGISVIYQEPTLFPDLTVAENIFIGRQPRGKLDLIDRQEMRNQASALFAQLGVPIDPDRVAEGLSIADQQIIEIAKAISLDARVLVMDEPTAALSGAEVDRLFAVARSLRDRGAAILFISHRFDEVFSLCERITVMRDGAYIATHHTAEITVDGLVREMVALAGLAGAGRTEVARAIFGIDRYDSGMVTISGRALKCHSPQAAIDASMGFVPEDRRKQGLVMELSVARNATLTLRKQLARFGLIDSRRERAAAEEWSRRIRFDCSPRSLASTA
jgi:rhamnose transport system ATP-binding protein